METKDQMLELRQSLEDWLDSRGLKIKDVIADSGGYYVNSISPMGRIDRIHLPEKYQNLDL